MVSITPTQAQAKFRYLSRNTTVEPSPHLYHLPPLSAFNDLRTLPMTDIKSSMYPTDPSTPPPYTLSTHGFVAVNSPSTMFSPSFTSTVTNSPFTSPTHLQNTYIPEVESLLLRLTGARKVFTDQVVIRNMLHTEVDALARSQDAPPSPPLSPKEEDKGTQINFPKLIGVSPTPDSGASPAPKVHLDLAPNGARMHLRRYHPMTTKLASEVIEAENAIFDAEGIDISNADLSVELKKFGAGGTGYVGPRWAMFSVWRPLKKVKRDPLAVGDCSTFPRDDYVDFGVLFPTLGKERETHRESGYLSYGPRGEEAGERHDWYWIKDQDVDEVLVIQLFDSEAEKEGRGMGGGVMHSSVELVGQNEGEDSKEARESCEVRCVVIW